MATIARTTLVAKASAAARRRPVTISHHTKTSGVNFSDTNRPRSIAAFESRRSRSQYQVNSIPGSTRQSTLPCHIAIAIDRPRTAIARLAISGTRMTRARSADASKRIATAHQT